MTELKDIVDEKTLTEKVKELALQGLTIAEISEKLNTKPSTVNILIYRLRTSASFDVQYDIGRKRSSSRQRIIDMFHRFNNLHGFFPRQTWIGDQLGISKQAVHQAKPRNDEEKDKFVKVERVKISKEFHTFLEQYADLFGITIQEALKSFSYNIDLGHINFERLKRTMIEKAQGRTDEDELI